MPQALVLEQDGVDWVYVFYSWKLEREPDAPWDFRYKEIRYMRCRAGDLLAKFAAQGDA